MRGKRSWGALATGGVVVAAGFAVAAVEMLGMPKGTIWVVVAVTSVLVLVIRRLTRP